MVLSSTARLALVAVVLVTALPAAAQAAGDDGPGTWFVFRTYPNGERGATPEQERRCASHFGTVRAPTALLKTNALEFVPRVDPVTGRAVSETASYLGPGFICVAPDATQDLNEAYAYASIPGMGEGEGTGPCTLAPQPAAGAVFVGCRLGLVPDPTVGLLGGFAASNTVSGSIFAAYVIPQPGFAMPPYVAPGEAPERGSLPNDPDFYVFRSFAHETSAASADCGAGARSSPLSSTQPDLRTSALDPDELRYRDAQARLCLTGGQAAVAQLELHRGGEPIRVSASGDCREFPTPAGADVRQQSCSLAVQSSTAPGFRGGLLTSTGLVPAGSRLDVAGSHVWVLSLLADAAQDAADTTPPVVELQAPGRARGRTVRVEWSATDDASQIHHYVLERRQTGRGRRWRTTETTATSATLRLHRGRHLVRVRAYDRAGNAGPWATRTVRVGRGGAP